MDRHNSEYVVYNSYIKVRKTNLFFCSLEEQTNVSLYQTKLVVDFGVRSHPLGELTDRTAMGEPARMGDHSLSTPTIETANSPFIA